MPTETKVKERGMLFSMPLVWAILEGRKTQTRRPVKKRQQPHSGILETGIDVMDGKLIGDDGVLYEIPCPYGVPGDRLWVRETWAEMDDGAIIYRANYVAGAGSMKWTPSIHMPRWASRITLEVTGVRIERVQEISEEDAMAEGVWCELYGVPEDAAPEPREIFETSWDEIYAQRGYSWKANPWVWVVEFKRLEA